MLSLDSVIVLTKGAKDDEGEGIANDPLSNGAKDHEETTETEVDTYFQIRRGLAFGYTHFTEA